MDLAECIYAETTAMPSSERFGITQQIRRSACSIAANVGEGSARSTDRDFASFISIARGSLRETETLWLLARRLGYVEESPKLNGLCVEVGKKLTQLNKKLRQQ